MGLLNEVQLTKIISSICPLRSQQMNPATMRPQHQPAAKSKPQLAVVAIAAGRGTAKHEPWKSRIDEAD